MRDIKEKINKLKVRANEIELITEHKSSFISKIIIKN